MENQLNTTLLFHSQIMYEVDMWKLVSKNQVEIVRRQRVIFGVFTTPIFLTEPLFFRQKRCNTGLIDIIRNSRKYCFP